MLDIGIGVAERKIEAGIVALAIGVFVPVKIEAGAETPATSVTVASNRSRTGSPRAGAFILIFPLTARRPW